MLDVPQPRVNETQPQPRLSINHILRHTAVFQNGLTPPMILNERIHALLAATLEGNARWTHHFVYLIKPKGSLISRDNDSLSSFISRNPSLLIFSLSN